MGLPHLGGRVLQILLGHRGEQLQGQRPQLAGSSRHETLHLRMVAPGGGGETEPPGVVTPAMRRLPLRRRESGDVCLADGILAGEPQIVRRPLSRRHLRGHGPQDGRSKDCGELPAHVPLLVTQRDRQRVALRHPERSVTETPVLPRPHEDVAPPQRQRGLARRIGTKRGHGVELPVIEYPEVHLGSRGRTARSVHHPHDGACRGRVVRGDVHNGVVAVRGDKLLVATVLPEHVGHHVHGLLHRRGEPRQIEPRLRLASPEVFPLAVHPHLNPGVVVVAMRPPRRVNLPSRNPHRPQRRQGENRLLAATPVRGAHRGQRRRRAGVRRLVYDMLVTPMIDLQGRLFHRAAPRHPLLQRAVEHPPGRIQGLVVAPRRKHEMTEHVFGNRPAPRHLLPRPQGQPDVLQKIIAAPMGDVAQGGIGEQEGQGLPLLRGHRLVEHGVQLPGLVPEQRLLSLKISFHRLPVAGIRNKMPLPAPAQEEQQATNVSDTSHNCQFGFRKYTRLSPLPLRKQGKTDRGVPGMETGGNEGVARG